jgi:hypothetical protein
LKEANGQLMVFDILRLRWLVCLPEEWVRQHWIHYLMNTLNYPRGLIAQEYDIPHHRSLRRADIVTFSRDMKPYLLIECKAPHVPLNQAVADQAAVYNTHLQAPYMAVSNGLLHLCAQMNNDLKGYTFLDNVPRFPGS